MHRDVLNQDEIDTRLGEVVISIDWDLAKLIKNIVTHPMIYNPPTPHSTALEVIRAWQESSGLRFLGEGPGYFETLSKQATKGKVNGPRERTDARHTVVVKLFKRTDARHIVVAKFLKSLMVNGLKT